MGEMLSKKTKVTVMVPTTAAAVGSSVISCTGSTDGSAQSLDMSGYEGVMFVAIPWGVTAAGQLGLAALTGDTSGTLTADTSRYSGTTGATATTDLMGDAIVLDVYRPTRRFAGVELYRATQNSMATVIAIQYGAHKTPVITSTSQLAGATTTLHFQVAYSTAYVGSCTS